MDSCSFCQIVSGDTDAYLLVEDDTTLAFLDNDPATDGHTLVIPKSHQEVLFTGSASIAAAVFETVQRVALALTDVLECDGVSLFYTSPQLVGQVAHAHVHLVPRTVDDEIHLALARSSLDETFAADLVEAMGQIV